MARRKRSFDHFGILDSRLSDALTSRANTLCQWKFNPIHHFYRYAYSGGEWNALKLLMEKRDCDVFRAYPVINMRVQPTTLLEFTDWVPNYIDIPVPVEVPNVMLKFDMLPGKNQMALAKWMGTMRKFQKQNAAILYLIKEIWEECNTLGRLVRIVPGVTAFLSDQSKAILNDKINQSPLSMEQKIRFMSQDKVYQWCNEIILSASLLPHGDHSPVSIRYDKAEVHPAGSPYYEAGQHLK
jgi:hypothetical protein